MPTIFAFVGRLMLALLFLISGGDKLLDLAGANAMITGVGLPSGLALPVGIFEVVAGLALIFGVLTRLFAILLAVFCLATALFFHNRVTDPMQAAMALKNIAIAGGLLCLFAQSQLRWSYDAIRDRRKSEINARDAELRAAKAEGIVEGTRGTTVTHTTPTRIG